MPSQNSSRKPQGKKSKSSNVEKSVGDGQLRDAQGRPLGRKAVRCIAKNADALDSLLEILEGATNAAEVQAGLKARYSTSLGRVTRCVGGGVLHVVLQGGETGTVRIAHKIAGHGRVTDNKRSLPNYFSVGDYAVVSAGDAEGKVRPSSVKLIRSIYERLAVPTARNFFVDAADADDEEDGIAWDRSDEAAVDAAELEQIRKARIQSRGGGRRVVSLLREVTEAEAVVCEAESEDCDSDSDSDSCSDSADVRLTVKAGSRKSRALAEEQRIAAEAKAVAAAAWSAASLKCRQEEESCLPTGDALAELEALIAGL